MNTVLPSFRNLLTAAVLACGVLFTLPAAAQQAAPGPGANPSPQLQKFMQKRAELQKLQEQLVQIQKKTLDKNPELQKQQQSFHDLMISKMKAKGHTPEKEIARLKTLEASLQDKNIDPQKRNELIQEYRDTNMNLQKAQQEVLQDTEVQQARQSLVKAVLVAMHNEDPMTEKLISQAKQTQEEMMEIRRQAMQSQAGASPQAH